MDLFVEVIITLVKVIRLWFVAVFKAIVPVKFLAVKEVRGQIVLITGAGSGLGRLMSQKFAALGCHLVLWDIDTVGNEETADLVKSMGVEAVTYTVDLSSREQIYQTAEKVKNDVGDVDILINNAGIVTGKKFLDCPDTLIEKTMDVNCKAHFWTTKCFLAAMLSRDHGHIVSVASSAGLFGASGLCDYCASKFAAVGFDESLRHELAKKGKTGVHTTVVCPYYINTGMFEGLKTRFPLILPILEPEFVVDKIMEAVLTNQEVLLTPKIMYLFYVIKGVVPVSVSLALYDFFGATDMMDDFVGRAKSR